MPRVLVLLLAALATAGASTASLDASVCAADADADWKADVLATLKGIGAKFDALDATVGALNAKVDALNATVGALAADVARVDAKVDALSESVVTPAVGARLEACASALAVAVVIFKAAAPSEFFHQCTAVPMPAVLASALDLPDLRASTLFLTAAHCFFENATLVGGPSTVAFDSALYDCSLAAHLYEPLLVPGQLELDYAPDSLDLAVLKCSAGVPIPAPLLTELPYTAHTPAALVGFARGQHLDLRLEAHATFNNSGVSIRKTYALHVKISRLSRSFQTPEPPNATAPDAASSASSGFVEDVMPPLLYAPASSDARAGFVDLTPWGGMSGGAIADTHCGLFGIISQRSLHAPGGLFVRLLPAVLERVAAAARGAAA